MIKFSEILKLATTGKEVTAELLLIDRLARKLDDLRETLANDAETMAQRFHNYSNKCAEGSVASPPTSYSTLNEIAVNEAKFQVLHETFKDLFPLLTGMKLRDVVAAIETGSVAS